MEPIYLEKYKETVYPVKDLHIKDYYISKSGLLFSHKRNVWRKLKPTFNQKINGYLQCGCGDGKGKIYHKYIHRLVAQTFILNLKNKKDVNHINGIKTDNRVENLEWLSRSDNQKHAYKIGLNGLNPWLKKRVKKVIQFKDGEIVAVYSDLKAVNKVTKMDQKQISLVCRGLKESYKGFEFKFSSEVLEV